MTLHLAYYCKCGSGIQVDAHPEASAHKAITLFKSFHMLPPCGPATKAESDGASLATDMMADIDHERDQVPS